MNKTDYYIKEDSLLARIAAKKLGKGNVAMVIGSTIHLWNATSAEFLQNERWVKHEMCHIKQFKQYGTIQFVFMYLWESFKKGYFNNKFEVEARAAETS